MPPHCSWSWNQITFSLSISASWRWSYWIRARTRCSGSTKAVKAAEDKTLEKALRELKKKSLDELKTLYKGLEAEPDMADESWTPKNKSYLGD